MFCNKYVCIKTCEAVIICNQGPPHYGNMPMQYRENCFGCKNENFHWKKIDIFLIFAQNIDCGYTLEARRF